MTSTLKLRNLGSLASLIATAPYERISDWKLWNILSAEIFKLHMQSIAGMLLHMNGKFTLEKMK
jgi:hypothetical protein